MSVRIANDLTGVDWAAVTADLVADDFDNGRIPAALHRSFAASQHVAIAWDDDRRRRHRPAAVGRRVQRVPRRRLDLARRIAAGAWRPRWSASSWRRCRASTSRLQTDDAQEFYETLGFRPQPELCSVVVGTWLDNDANRDA